MAIGMAWVAAVASGGTSLTVLVAALTWWPLAIPMGMCAVLFVIMTITFVMRNL